MYLYKHINTEIAFGCIGGLIVMHMYIIIIIIIPLLMYLHFFYFPLRTFPRTVHVDHVTSTWPKWGQRTGREVKVVETRPPWVGMTFTSTKTRTRLSPTIRRIRRKTARKRLRQRKSRSRFSTWWMYMYCSLLLFIMLPLNIGLFNDVMYSNDLNQTLTGNQINNNISYTCNEYKLLEINKVFNVIVGYL